MHPRRRQGDGKGGAEESTRGAKDREQNTGPTSTHLLANHNNTRSLRRTSQPRNRKQLDEPRKHIAMFRQTRFLQHPLFIIQLRLDSIQIPRGLQRRISQLQQRLICLCHATFLQQPARRFGTEIYAKDEGNCRNHGGSELESPGQRARMHKDEIGAGAEEDAKGGPDLPGHDEAAADAGGGILGGEDRHRDFFETHADAEQHPTCH